MFDFFARHADKFIRGQDDECWTWVGAKNSHGYGHVRLNRNSNLYAHRAAYEVAHGTGSAEGLVIRHKCDNPLCINPSHLEGGTQMQNRMDMLMRNRAFWENRTHCKNGHEYSPENIRKRTDGNGRVCKKCSAMRDQLRKKQKCMVR